MTSSSRADSTDAISRAAAFLRDGKLVAFATETVYGLGADATNAEAVAAIFEAKGRPRFNPLIIHVPDVAAARSIVAFNDMAEKLAARFWPGALTFVLPRAPDCPVCRLAGAGPDTLAIRVPAKEPARRPLRKAAVPVAAPRANKSGKVSPTRADHVVDAFGDEVAMVLDDGPCLVGLESTVIGLTGSRPAILRHGGVPAEDIETVTGSLAAPNEEKEAPSSPGMLLRHYATAAPLRLDAQTVGKNEALLAFGRDIPSHSGKTLNLSAEGDLREAAANLFEMMRRLDELAPGAIAVMPIPETGLGAAINDRLRRAAER